MNIVAERRSPVSPDYRHVVKIVRHAPSLALGESILKWYDIAPADQPVPAEIRQLARDNLRTAASFAELDLDADLGFVILHRCGESFYFLLLCTWRGDNELWETVWAKDGDDADSFRPWPIDGPHRPTFCVWELRAVWHEQQAWSRYLRSARDEEAGAAYLRATFSGAV